MKIIYLLLGYDACEELDTNGIDSLIDEIDNGIGYITYKWDYNNGDVLDLLSTFQGWHDYSVISEDEFNRLNNL